MNIIGLKRHTVKLINHIDEWERFAKSIIDELNNASSKLVCEIEHVGSTAVKGLPAKPIIDIAIAIKSLEVMSVLIEIYIGLEYIYRGDGGDDGGHLFVPLKLLSE